MNGQEVAISRGRRIRPAKSQETKDSLRVSYLTDRALGKGRILSLSARGCIVEGDVPLPVGCWVHLFFPEFSGTDAAFVISWAIVRSTEGRRFSAKFLSMPASQWKQLGEIVEQGAGDEGYRLKGERPKVGVRLSPRTSPMNKVLQ